jgi:WD40 repeat protein
LKEDFDRKEIQLRAKLNQLEQLNDEMSNLGFEPGCDIDVDLFGNLDLVGSYTKLISTAGNDINLYKIVKDSSLKPFKQRKPVKKLSHNSAVNALQIFQKNKLISGYEDGTIKVWDLKSFTCVTTLTGHTTFIISLKLLKHDLLSSGSGDKSIRLWDVSSNGMFSFISSLNGHTGTVRCLEQLQNEHLISGSDDKSIKQWNLSNGTCVKTFSFHTDWVLCLKVLSDKTFASGSRDKTVRIINFISSECMRVFNGHTDSVLDLEIYPKANYRHRLMSCSDDHNILIWDLDNGQQVKALKGHTSSVRCIKMTNNGKTLISGGYTDKCFKIWDLETGNFLKTITCTHEIWNFVLC